MVDSAECYVSLWVGNVDSDELLSDYISVNYEDEESDSYGYSQFMKNFDIDELYEDDMERIFHDKETSSLRELLSGCSYEDKVIPEFEKILSDFPDKNYNFAILVYDMNYDGNITMADDDYYWIKFIDTVKITIKK
ncbi:MAG: immunity 22 family protein [Ruminococcus flavefaciens]|nr:immunity 22 family protein [Ruminococcus flavefaciens]